MTKRLVLSLAVSLLVSSAALAQQVFTTTLIGANEPDGGDPNGIGTAVVTFNGTQVNFLLTAQNLSTNNITGAHIHRLSSGSIVVPFPATFTNGVATGTTTASSQALVDEITANPSAFYVNVHTSAHPGGAIRGNLNGGPGASGQDNPSSCTSSDTVLCLGANNRFKVEATWKTAAGDTGVGHATKLTSDTGTFWFFNSTNVEMIVKALNACSFSTQQWIFASGLTNVSVTLKVTDTSTGKTRTYSNSLGNPFQAIQDTSAFPCP